MPFSKTVSAFSKGLYVGSNSPTEMSSSSVETIPQEQKIKVNDVYINHCVAGHGSHAVLLLPGCMGSVWTHFKNQIEGLDWNQFTLVAWDPPGYGKSIPPSKNYPRDYCERDANFATGLMEALGFQKYSLVSFSEGGAAAMIMAARNPDKIRRMVLCSASTHTLPGELKVYELLTGNVNLWEPNLREMMKKMYSETYFKSTGVKYLKTCTELFKENSPKIPKDILPNIVCPTLIVHGALDPIVFKQHADFLHQRIANSEKFIFENGQHTIQLQFPNEFNTLVSNFLIEELDE